MHTDREERAIARNQLREVIDLAAYPSELVYQMALSPTLYNAGTRRFEFQRTPNRFLAFTATLTLNVAVDLANAVVISADGSDLKPRDGKIWRVLGGRYSVSALTVIQFMDGLGGKVFEETTLAANVATNFQLVGNGVLIPQGQRIAMQALTAGCVLVCVLQISEEEDTGARGSV
jgi:hypothetical protein